MNIIEELAMQQGTHSQQRKTKPRFRIYFNPVNQLHGSPVPDEIIIVPLAYPFQTYWYESFTGELVGIKANGERI